MTPASRALLRAAADGDAHRLRALLVQGTNVNSTNGAGQTPLMLAAAFNHQDIVNLLLKARANVEIQDDLGLTALDWGTQFPAITELISKAMQPPDPFPAAASPKEDSPQADHAVAFAAAAPLQKPAAEVQKPALKGLAGAILRDRKPIAVEEVQSAGPSPENVQRAEVISNQVAAGPRIRPVATDDTIDQTLSSTNPSDDTEPGSRNIQRGRIFEQLAPQPTPPLSKVEVHVPEPSQQRSWAGTLIWLVPVVLVGAVLFGSYQLVSYLLGQKQTPQTQSTTAANPKPTPITAAAPIVGGELAGTELYLPDVQYPADVEPGQAANVTVNVRVSAKGIVFAANAADGQEPFRTIAEKTARSAAFSPEKLQGRGSVVDGTITYSFASKQPPQINTPTGLSVPGKVSAVAGGPLAGAALMLALPDYSHTLRNEGVSGDVTVVVRVTRSGKVKSWRPLDGDPRLRAACIKAAKRSTFSPDKLPGDTEVVGTITYTFQ